MKVVDVIIPVYKPDEKWRLLVEMLNGQSYPIAHLIVVNTGRKYWKTEYETWASNMQVFHVEPEEYDHGGTRDLAARKSKADYLLFMTQDAVPANADLVKHLVEALEQREDTCTVGRDEIRDEPPIAAAYARQLPTDNCRPAERFTRRFNYPAESCVKTKADLPRLGIKTYFCSNVCAMYRRDVYLQLGGFVKKTIFNEDMIFAGKLILQGYAVAYAAGAEVIHSHNYSAMQQFHRNFDLAVSQAEHPEVFAGIRSESEGIRLVKQTAEWLLRQGKPWLVVALFWNSGWKYLGYLLGKRYKKLPRWFVLWCTMNPRYWK